MPDPTNTGVVPAMYGADPEAEQRADALRRTRAAADEVRRTGRSSMIRIDGREVEVPTLAYVAQIERKIEDQGRSIARLEALLHAASRMVNRQASEIDGLRSDVSRSKWDI